jgi:hypothetical protein
MRTLSVIQLQAKGEHRALVEEHHVSTVDDHTAWRDSLKNVVIK